MPIIQYGWISDKKKMQRSMKHLNRCQHSDLPYENSGILYGTKWQCDDCSKIFTLRPVGDEGLFYGWYAHLWSNPIFARNSA